jgi:ATP synthase F1 delta subunit
MNTAKIARKYAKMLFNSVEFSKFEEALHQAGDVSELMKKSKEIHAALTSPLFSPGEKAKTISILAKSMKLSPSIESYLNFLTQKGAAPFLNDIILYAVDMYNEKKKKAVATVITPVRFTDALSGRLKASLKKITSKEEVDIEYVHDPSLLGGFVVKIGSAMYDSSLKGQLRLLKEELIKG